VGRIPLSVARAAMTSIREASNFDDYLTWLNSQIELLRARKFDQLDLDDLISELDDMGRSRKRELKNRLMVLVKHLLKCKIQSDHVSNGWLGTLNEQHSAIDSLLEDAPSLVELVPEYLHGIYRRAVKEAIKDTGLPAAAFPPDSPFTPAQVLDAGFIPGSPALRKRIRHQRRG
jgi:hypothetical protein